jgi:hypothetical protein
MSLEKFTGMDKTMTTRLMHEVVAVVKARGEQKLTTIEMIAFELELPVPELRAAARLAVEEGLLRRGSSDALGVYYYV